MKDLVCSVCGYVRNPVEIEINYESASNEEDKNEELPDGWVCPNCGIKKEEFEELK